MEFHKYSKIYQLGNEENKGIFSNPDSEICIQEKVDGANFRVYIVKDSESKIKVIFGSRTQQLTSNEGDETNVEKNFRRAIKFVKEKLEKVDLTPYVGLTLFMENMVKHTLSYNWDITPPVIGFDILCEVEEEKSDYLHWNVAKKVFEELGFEFIPIVKVCKASEIKEVTDDLVPISKYTTQQAEGIVFKSFQPERIYAKYVRNVFKEKNKEVFGGGKKQATDDEEYFTAIYCTNYRIEKQVLKLLDEGMKLEKALMKYLPNRVYDDLWEENWKELIHAKQKTITFDEFRRKVTARCLNVLSQMIVNQALNQNG